MKGYSNISEASYLTISRMGSETSLAIVDKIDSFLLLKDGWHYGDGIAPKLGIIDTAKQIATTATLLGNKVDAFPGIYGEIQVCSYYANLTREFTIETNGTIHLIQEEDDIEIDEREVTLTEALGVIRKGKDECNILDYSTKFISTNTEGDSQVLRSKIPPIMGGYQLLNQYA